MPHYNANPLRAVSTLIPASRAFGPSPMDRLIGTLRVALDARDGYCPAYAQACAKLAWANRHQVRAPPRQPGRRVPGNQRRPCRCPYPRQSRRCRSRRPGRRRHDARTDCGRCAGWVGVGNCSCSLHLLPHPAPRAGAASRHGHRPGMDHPRLRHATVLGLRARIRRVQVVRLALDAPGGSLVDPGVRCRRARPVQLASLAGHAGPSGGACGPRLCC